MEKPTESMAETFTATQTGDSSHMGEDFAALLAESLGDTAAFEGTVVKGTVVSIENDMALIDVGLKSEGRVALKEFAAPGQPSDLKIGDVVDVYVKRQAPIVGAERRAHEVFHAELR